LSEQPIGDPANRYYETAFDSPSIGTEEELSGPAIKVRQDAEQLIGVVSKGEDPLVLITKDLGLGSLADGYASYTIELRTTPAMIEDRDAWRLRRKALQATIWAIQDSLNKPLSAGPWLGLKFEILNPDHAIHALPGSITGSGRQSTVAVPALDLLTGGQPAERETGRLHQYVTLPWYQEKLTGHTAAAGLNGTSAICFALLVSALLKLVTLPQPRDSEGRPDNTIMLPMNNTEAKNAWQVRPRTPLARILKELPEAQASAVYAAVATFDPPDGHVTQKWQLARAFILNTEKPLGGHTPPVVTIDGDPAMLFEYRSDPIGTDFAFWKYQEFDRDDFPVT